MESKLTLSMDAAVIERAKAFARKNKTSLSQLAEDYFLNLTRKEEKLKQAEISASVKSLSGVLRLPADFDHKAGRGEYIREKHK